MKKIKKVASITIAVMILAAMAVLPASADGSDNITVSLRIEGIAESMYYNQAIELAAGATVADLLATVNEMEDSPEIILTDGAYGAYVGEIDGLAEFAYGDMSGWSYRVNGLSPTFGIDLYELENGDEVVNFYGDPFGIGMQYPIADLSRLVNDGIIKFTSIDSEYDEDWNEIYSENPVGSAEVTFDAQTYTTDENGEITIADKTGISGFHTLQIERYDEQSGVPTVLRLAPDFEIYAPFADTPDEAWYDGAVMFCVGEGYFIGTDLALNLFAPMNKMRMDHLVIVLARIAGAYDPSDAGGAVTWALENEILGGNEFVVGINVTRETFISMFYRTVDLIGSYDMTDRADITGAADYGDISEDCLETVSWAVAAGIIRGTSENELTIDPGFEINRATVCQMLYNYYN